MGMKPRRWTKAAVAAAKERGIRGQLTESTGYSEDHISMCLRGKRATSPDLAAKLAAALGIPASNFGQPRAKAVAA